MSTMGGEITTSIHYKVRSTTENNSHDTEAMPFDRAKELYTMIRECPGKHIKRVQLVRVTEAVVQTSEVDGK